MGVGDGVIENVKGRYLAYNLDPAREHISTVSKRLVASEVWRNKHSILRKTKAS